MLGQIVRVVALLLLAGCVQQESFADETQDARDRQAEVIDEFINARYDQLEHSIVQFERYVGLVHAQETIPQALFYEGQPLFRLIEGETENLLAEFLASSAGAALSAQHREYFERARLAREKQAGTVYDAVFGRLEARGAADLVRQLNLLEWFAGGLAMRELLDGIPDELLQECAGEIRTAMLDFDRAELWQALVSGQEEALLRYRESGPLPSLEYLTVGQVQPVVQEHVSGPLEHFGRLLVANALGDAFAMGLYAVEYADLKQTGFNELMGEERAARLHARARRAAQAVELAANDTADERSQTASL
jgi:hypothetical protein